MVGVELRMQGVKFPQIRLLSFQGLQIGEDVLVDFLGILLVPPLVGQRSLLFPSAAFSCSRANLLAWIRCCGSSGSSSGISPVDSPSLCDAGYWIGMTSARVITTPSWERWITPFSLIHATISLSARKFILIRSVVDNYPANGSPVRKIAPALFVDLVSATRSSQDGLESPGRDSHSLVSHCSHPPSSGSSPSKPTTSSTFSSQSSSSALCFFSPARSAASRILSAQYSLEPTSRGTNFFLEKWW